jgi:predicted metal-dependent enzyme (double-stranded beta helix superfamily)
MFPPGFVTGIHDHSAPAVIGVWARHEDNWLYRHAGERIEALDPRRVETGSVLLLGESAIHDVHAPGDGWSGALHVYLGDILNADRSSWPDPGAPAHPFDGADLGSRRRRDGAHRADRGVARGVTAPQSRSGPNLSP